MRAEGGLRNKLGFRDYVTGLGGDVRTLLGFRGSLGDGTRDRFFACTTAGIFNCTASTATPSSVYSFGIVDAFSGIGAGRGFVNSNGDHFLVYADESNGYLVYSEITGTWVKVVQAANTAWIKNTVYGAGAYVSNKGSTYYTAAGGTSENTDNAGPSGTSSAITDGTVTWAYTPAISGVNPDDIAFVTVAKNRVWLVKKNSQTGYYLPIGSLYGVAQTFHFGPQFKGGGYLVGIWTWTLDGGAGMDDHLVAISSSGDIVMYLGTDPSSSSTWALKGSWNVGAVPVGRRITTDNGGDLVIMSTLGAFPLSKMLAGANFQQADSDIYETRKIAPAIGRIMTERATSLGWELLIHPEDKALLLLTPAVTGSPREQWSMPLASRGWSQHTGTPMATATSWKGKLYFGTSGGKVCVNDGDADNVGIADANNATAIEWWLITAPQSLGNANRKRLQGVAPRFITSGTVPQFSIEGRFNFDVSDPGSIQYVSTPGITTWGTPWGVMIWGSGQGIAGEYRGVAGEGAAVAIALRVASMVRTTLVGFHVLFEQGGP